MVRPRTRSQRAGMASGPRAFRHDVARSGVRSGRDPRADARAASSAARGCGMARVRQRFEPVVPRRGGGGCHRPWRRPVPKPWTAQTGPGPPCVRACTVARVGARHGPLHAHLRRGRRLVVQRARAFGRASAGLPPGCRRPCVAPSAQGGGFACASPLSAAAGCRVARRHSASANPCPPGKQRGAGSSSLCAVAAGLCHWRCRARLRSVVVTRLVPCAGFRRERRYRHRA